jgi:hypothetical protein
MDQTSLVQQCQTIEELLSKHANQRSAETPELVLLDKFVEVNTQELKDQAEMLSMDKSILQA